MGHGIRYIFNEKYFLFILLEFIENSHESHESYTLSHVRLKQHELDTEQKTVLFSLQLMYLATPPGPHASFPAPVSRRPCHVSRVMTCHNTRYITRNMVTGTTDISIISVSSHLHLNSEKQEN